MLISNTTLKQPQTSKRQVLNPETEMVQSKRQQTEVAQIQSAGNSLPDTEKSSFHIQENVEAFLIILFFCYSVGQFFLQAQEHLSNITTSIVVMAYNPNLISIDLDKSSDATEEKEQEKEESSDLIL